MDVESPYTLAPPDDRKRWTVVYPAYINAKKTQAQGRRIPKSKAVDVPQVAEIKDVLSNKGFTVEIETKQYPREYSRDHAMSGRVRVQLLNADGEPVNPDCQSRRDLLYLICELIPNLKTRYSSRSGAVGGGSDSQSSSSKKKKKHK